MRQGFGGLMDFFVSGANLAALGPATGQGPQSMAVIKLARHTFDENERDVYVSVRHLNPGSNLCVKGFVVLRPFL